MIETLERFLQCEWAVFCPGQRLPRRVRIAMLSSSREMDGTRVLLAFADQATTPSLVCRIPRHPGGAKRLEGEWQLLQRLWETLPETVRPLVPEPLCMTTVRGMPVFVQRALPGRNLKTSIQRGHRSVSRKQLARDLASMDRWLDRFQQAIPPAGGSTDGDVSRQRLFAVRVQGARSALERAHLVTPQQGAWLIARAEALDSAFEGRSACWVHGDLWPGNVMEHGKRWGVIDWDDVSVGPPWVDRMWFALHLAALYHARRAQESDLREALARVVFGRDAYTKVLRKHLASIFPATLAPGVTSRDAALVLLATCAADVVLGRPTRRVFALAAPELLKTWLSGRTPVAL